MDPTTVLAPEQQTVPTSETAPVQQVPTSPANPPAEDWKKRFDGAILKIQELTNESKAKDGQLAEKSSAVEQLTGQLSSKEAEMMALTGQKETEFTELQNQFNTANTELAKLQALKLKLEVAQELGQPGLISILDTIPDSTDKAQLKSVMESVVNFANGQVKAREQVLTAGVTPSNGTVTLTMPATQAEWDAKISSLPDGSAERQAAWDAFYVWAKSHTA